jgi:hypothetical protein
MDLCRHTVAGYVRSGIEDRFAVNDGISASYMQATHRPRRNIVPIPTRTRGPKRRCGKCAVRSALWPAEFPSSAPGAPCCAPGLVHAGRPSQRPSDAPVCLPLCTGHGVANCATRRARSSRQIRTRVRTRPLIKARPTLAQSASEPRTRAVSSIRRNSQNSAGIYEH